jgi:hypothetical protein
MDSTSCVIYGGQKFVLEWYYDKNGKSVAYDYFMESTERLQDQFLVLVKKWDRIIQKGKPEVRNNENNI